MERILLLAHTQADGALPAAAAEALGVAIDLGRALGGASIQVGLVGAEVQAAADAVAPAGPTRILGVRGEAFGQARYATDSASAEALCRHSDATLIVAPATSRWNRVLPGVAYRLGGRADTHVTGIEVDEDGILVGRWFYRQRIEARVRRAHRPWVLLVEPGLHPPFAGGPTSAVVASVEVGLDPTHTRTQVVGFETPTPDTQTIRPDAELLLVAGAGWTKKQRDGESHVPEAAAVIDEFLRRTRASLGSSKSLVDLASEGHAVLPFMSHLNQVGQTGSSPRHPKGLATCCHGEEPHVVGWRFIAERRAINLDPNCGWVRGKADVVYVADAFAVLARVNALLAAGTGREP